MSQVMVREEKVIIPTYEVAPYDKNPMFLEKRVYQGSSGKVYPHPVCEGVFDVKIEKEYKAVFLENEYIMVMILPELGGRIQRLYDKTNGYDAVYYNEVIKPALVGLAGPWISGGIEFNWPQHHRPSTFDPVDYRIVKNQDGSVTVWVGETEKMFHTKGMAGFCVYPEKAYLEIKGQVYNPTEQPQTFLWWANPAVAVNDFTQSVFPPDVTAVMDHGKRDVSKFPIADGVYYKVDYAPGTDISRYKNIPVPTSYMAAHSDYDFIGNYDHEKKAGLLHIADHHVSPGKKQWTWGNGDFGRAWDRNLTDENGPYIELMTGMFTDNQPDFTFLKPYEEKTFTQYFMPYKKAGAVKNASLDCFVNLEVVAQQEGMDIEITLYAPVVQKEICVSLYYEGQLMFEDVTDVSPVQTYVHKIPAPKIKEELLSVVVKKNAKILVQYQPQSKDTSKIPEPAKALPEPAKVETTERLFLAATHLEQYRHATYSPEDYYLEGLRRDASDIRLNNGYGKYLYRKGLFEEAIPYFKQALQASTWKNPNPYDCEPYYNLGLALARTGDMEKAYDAFYKATWDGAMQDKAFYELACIAAKKKQYEQAYEFIEKSLQKGTHHIKARTVKTALLRILGKKEEALLFARKTQKIDPLDHGAVYEYAQLANESERVDAYAYMRGDAHNYIELALTYIHAGFYKDAERILRAAPQNMTPMTGYYLFMLTGEAEDLAQAEQTEGLYCFPNRLEDMASLQYAVQKQGHYAAYYLGNLYYDKGRWKEACALWEHCKEQIALPTVYRNLSLVYYNKMQNAAQAVEALEKAFRMDQTDARVFFELDQLYKATNQTVAFRLQQMQQHEELLEKRDDLYTEYMTLLNLTGKYELAYEKIMQHKFHPWEGGEGKIPAQYRFSLLHMADVCQDKEQKKAYLTKALTYPTNLGEGKLVGNLDQDIYYRLGLLSQDKEQALAYFTLAARGDLNLNSAMYYNDQPPQMQFYAVMAMKALGHEKQAKDKLEGFIAYAKEHEKDDIKIDYFAVSLPDFLIFEGDLKKKNQVHCCYMKALGYYGLALFAEAAQAVEAGLQLENCHEGLVELARLLEETACTQKGKAK